MAVNPGMVQFDTFVGHGQVDIDGASEQLPDVKGKVVYLKASGANTGTIFIGNSTAVTVVTANATNTTSGFPLAAGQEIGPFPLVTGSLSGLWAIASAADQELVYIILR